LPLLLHARIIDQGSLSTPTYRHQKEGNAVKSPRNSIAIIIIAAIFNISFWLFEIVVIKKWASLNWLKPPLYAPYAIALLTTIAYLAPIQLHYRASRFNWLKAVGGLYFFSLAEFYAGKQLCYALYSRYWIITKIDLAIGCIAIGLLFTGLAVACYFSSRQLKRGISYKPIFANATLFFCVIPLSLLSVKLIPGYGAGSGWIDAVKMGYPAFWITILLGVAALRTIRLQARAAQTQADS